MSQSTMTVLGVEVPTEMRILARAAGMWLSQSSDTSGIDPYVWPTREGGEFRFALTALHVIATQTVVLEMRLTPYIGTGSHILVTNYVMGDDTFRELADTALPHLIPEMAMRLFRELLKTKPPEKVAEFDVAKWLADGANLKTFPRIGDPGEPTPLEY